MHPVILLTILLLFIFNQYLINHFTINITDKHLQINKWTEKNYVAQTLVSLTFFFFNLHVNKYMNYVVYLV